MAGGSRSRSPRRDGRSEDADARRDHDRAGDRDRRGADRDGDRDRNRDRDRRDRDRNRDRDSDRDRDRDRPRQPRGTGGFRWKDKRSDNNLGEEDNRRGGALERGYRNRSPRRDRDRDRDRQGRDGRDDRRDNSRRDQDRSSRPSASSSAAPTAPAPSGAGEEMIVVHINDRLGTKAAIPCFASDKVREFKIMVAARIGREPHEILLKRQGERPFKDQLSLEDYGVSNGVQLDLEVDTGD